VKRFQDLNTHYTRNGSGKTIILLHGWGCDHAIFQNIATLLLKDYEVCTLDLPGFGKSEAPKTCWDTNDYSNFIKDFIKKENITNPILIGHSFGGKIAISYASQNPVEKLILVGSAGIKPKRNIKYRASVLWFKLFKKLTKLLLSQKQAGRIIENKRKNSGSADYRNARGIMRDILVKVVNEDLQHLMPRVKAPALLIWGDKDTATPVRDAQLMQKLIPDAGLVTMKDTGHYCFLEKPADFMIITHYFLTH
jgi:pimeloyl-ACP methyl ester carboxylesterase